MHIPLELFSPLSPSVNNTEKHVAVNCGLIWISNLMQSEFSNFLMEHKKCKFIIH